MCRRGPRLNYLNYASVLMPNSGPLIGGSGFPYHLVEPTVFFLDLIVVLSIGLISAVGYSLAFYQHVEGVEGQLAFGALAFAKYRRCWPRAKLQGSFPC